MRNPRGNNEEMSIIIQAAISPLLTEMQTLKSEVHSQAVHMVTRTDFEKLRNEINTSFVTKDNYEPRHTSLETATVALRRDMETSVDKMQERINSGKLDLDKRLRDIQESQISDRDRAWIRWTQIFGLTAVGISILGLILQHIKFF